MTVQLSTISLRICFISQKFLQLKGLKMRSNLPSKVCVKRQLSTLLHILLVQNMFLATSALPAKSGPSSKSLETYAGVNSGTLQDGGAKVESTEAINASPKPFKITVFPWNNHLGRPAPMEWTDEEVKRQECKEIPSRWQGKVRSVHTHDNCIILFSEHSCKGSSKTLEVGSPSHNRLSDLCFQRKPISARPCTKRE